MQRAQCLPAPLSLPGLPADQSPGQAAQHFENLSFNIKSTFQSPVITYYILIASPAP